MSIRILLDNPPEFYTNLDEIRGHVVLNLSRHEHIGAIIVKLEGESRTVLGTPPDHPTMVMPGSRRRDSDDALIENHKILYKVGQVFPDVNAAPAPAPCVLNPGQHRFPFKFKFPFNNACGDAQAMARIGGVAAGGMFGVGIRVMDGSKQLMYKHVTKTLPPSFTGFPGEAEIRYYVKVTIQRPGIFKENWRHQMGLKFLPIEPPRPPKTAQEAYARRPFTFHARSLSPTPLQPKRSSFFGMFRDSPSPANGTHSRHSPAAGAMSNGPPSPSLTAPATPPSIEMSARLPHPAILTCNKHIPLRLIAKKTVPAHEEVYLIAMQIDLVGKTTVRCQNLVNTEVSRWVILSRQGLSTLISRPEDPVGSEFVVPESLWNTSPLPNTVMPSFVTCNLSRDYQLEVKLGLSWGKPSNLAQNPSLLGHRPNKQKDASNLAPQELHLPLHFSTIQVYSGLTPPAALVEAMRQGGRTTRPAANPTATPQTPSQQPPLTPTNRPNLPPRPAQPPQQQQQEQPPDALYPPQLQPGQVPGQGQGEPSPAYDDAPPSYDEAMAEEMTGPVFPAGAARPAYSGVTDENAGSSLPEKR